MSEDDLILIHVLRCKPHDLLLQRPRLSAAQQQQFDAIRARRQQGEPLQYLLGAWDFYGLEFMVDARVLVPRPETEGLVERALERCTGGDALDLGTGSGNIAVTLAKLRPDVRVVAVDVSDGALEVARENARRHGVQDRIDFVHGGMEDYLAGTGKVFDLIISNPPYIPSADLACLPLDVRQEPAAALDGGADGLDFYRRITKSSPRLLRRGGYLMMEFGDGQANAVAELVTAGRAFSAVDIHRDLAGRERVIVCKK